MKTKTSLLILLASVSAAFLASCTLVIITPTGVDETITWPTADFDRVEVDSAFSVTVTQGDSCSVSTTSDTSLSNFLSVYVSGSTLHIGITDSILSSGGTRTAQITLPSLTMLKANEASTVNLGSFASSSLTLRVDNASTILTGDISAAALSINTDNASSASLGSLSVTTMDAYLGNASSTVLTQASLITLTIDASEASDFSAPANSAVCQNLYVTLSDASHISMDASVFASGTVSDASTLILGGNASTDLSKDFSSTIRYR